jgi:signal transduction histidine kinase
MLSFSVFTLAVAALFGLFAMAFVYTIEDRFIDRWVENEAKHLRAQYASSGTWPQVQRGGMQIARHWSELPPDLRNTMRDEPHRREVAGTNGRHYHLVSLEQRAQPPWLVAEVSDQLLVRPIREKLLRWLIVWGLVVVLVSLLLAWGLARHTSAPLARMALRIAQTAPNHLPILAPENRRGDEVGSVARSFDALFTRVSEFVAREQAFTRDASHELRTPLAVLRMSIERLQSEAHSSETHRVLNGMHASALLMQQTVETMLQIAREDSLPISSVPLLPIVERWALAHSNWLDEQPTRLQVELDKSDCLALPEAVASLVVSNLLHNAFAHGGSVGAVVVSMKCRQLCIVNPSRSAQYIKRDTSHESMGAAHGFGLTIVRRLLSRYGASLTLIETEISVEARVAMVEPNAAMPSQMLPIE